jgi:copper chaperone CopZ
MNPELLPADDSPSTAGPGERHAAHSAANSPDAARANSLGRTDLPIEGMTCASCAIRIEQRLGKQRGVVSASVNFATRVATVRYDPAKTGAAALARAVEEIGYKAIVPSARAHHATGAGGDHGDRKSVV